MPRDDSSPPSPPPGLRFRQAFPFILHGLARHNSDDVRPDDAEAAGPQQISLPERELVNMQASESNAEARPSEVVGDETTVIGMEDDDRTTGASRRRTPLDVLDGGPQTMWNVEDDAANEARRREAIRHEIERTQRSNFIHFSLLCLVPTSLLLIVVASVLGEDDDCSGYPTSCVNEPRSFINAFTTRCICDAIVAEP